MALGYRQSSGKHLPAAPALSHGFGGEGVAMVLPISGVASRYYVRYIQIDPSRELKGERREKREEKDACGREWRCRGRGLPKNTGYRCLVYRHEHTNVTIGGFLYLLRSSKCLHVDNIY